MSNLVMKKIWIKLIKVEEIIINNYLILFNKQNLDFEYFFNYFLFMRCLFK